MNIFRVVGVATICTDVYVFSRWHFRPRVDRDPNDKSGIPPPMDPAKRQRHVKYMTENWTCSLKNVREGRWWTMVTAAFSHIEIGHLALSIWGLYQGYRTLNFIGVSAPRSIALALGSAVAANAAYLADMSTRPANQQGGLALGASGILCGMFSGAMLVAPTMQFGIPFLPITFNLRTMVLAYTAMDLGFFVWETVSRERKANPLFGRDSFIAYSAHLGGTVFGAVFYALALRKYRVRMPPPPPPPPMRMKRR